MTEEECSTSNPYQQFSQIPIESSHRSTFIDDSDNSLSSTFTNISREVVRESVLAYQNSKLAAYALSQDIVKGKL